MSDIRQRILYPPSRDSSQIAHQTRTIKNVINDSSLLHSSERHHLIRLRTFATPKLRKKLSQALTQRKGQIGCCEGTGGKAVRTSPHCLSESEFAGACAELLLEGEKVGVAAKRSGVERERLVCFSFASIFFCTSKENAQTHIVFRH